MAGQTLKGDVTTEDRETGKVNGMGEGNGMGTGEQGKVVGEEGIEEDVGEQDRIGSEQSREEGTGEQGGVGGVKGIEKGIGEQVRGGGGDGVEKGTGVQGSLEGGKGIEEETGQCRQEGGEQGNDRAMGQEEQLNQQWGEAEGGRVQDDGESSTRGGRDDPELGGMGGAEEGGNLGGRESSVNEGQDDREAGGDMGLEENEIGRDEGTMGLDSSSGLESDESDGSDNPEGTLIRLGEQGESIRERVRRAMAGNINLTNSTTTNNTTAQVEQGEDTLAGGTQAEEGSPKGRTAAHSRGDKVKAIHTDEGRGGSPPTILKPLFGPDLSAAFLSNLIRSAVDDLGDDIVGQISERNKYWEQGFDKLGGLLNHRLEKLEEWVAGELRETEDRLFVKLRRELGGERTGEKAGESRPVTVTNVMGGLEVMGGLDKELNTNQKNQ